MSTLEVRWVWNRLPVVADKLPGLVEAMVTKATIDLEGEAKVNASGRPGPKVVTGLLRGSISHAVQRRGERTQGRVFTNVEYAPYLEYGTRYAPPYPFLGPAVQVMQGRMGSLMRVLAGSVEGAA